MKDDFNEETLREIFDSIDEDKNGELDTEEFGKAILSTLKPAEWKVKYYHWKCIRHNLEN